MTLTNHLVVGEGVEVVEHKAGRGFLDAQGLPKGIDGLDPWSLLLVSHLTRYVPYEVSRKIQSLYDVLGGVGLPSYGELDVAADLPMAIAGVAVHFAFGAALGAVLLAVAVFRVLAVEAPALVSVSIMTCCGCYHLPLAVTGAVVHPTVAVTVQASGPPFTVAITTSDAASAAATMA